MTVIEARDVPEATSGGKGGTRNERRGACGRRRSCATSMTVKARCG